MSSRIFHILAQKGNVVLTVKEDDPVLSVANLLIRHNIGGAPVMGANGALAGMVSERAIVNALTQYGPNIASLTAKEIMLKETPTASPDDNIFDIANRMTWSRSRHVPVLEDGKLVGLVSIGDIVKLRAENAEQEAQELQDYVTGSNHAAVKPHDDSSRTSSKAQHKIRTNHRN
ncbi:MULTISPECIES: CBS domain-containing protein [Acetobacter]|uniref:Cystathionine beta-synthase n=1 Tax=Acetobacter tropicalis TaxID=104102 RepID=A0A291PMN8_9PROT|nr:MULTISPECIES: CBS domain-containing protein [Acetobacter]ATJ92696.1 cystathionine beta-synthase [Acetobacter tropicalis]